MKSPEKMSVRERSFARVKRMSRDAAVMTIKLATDGAPIGDLIINGAGHFAVSAQNQMKIMKLNRDIDTLKRKFTSASNAHSAALTACTEVKRKFVDSVLNLQSVKLMCVQTIPNLFKGTRVVNSKHDPSVTYKIAEVNKVEVAIGGQITASHRDFYNDKVKAYKAALGVTKGHFDKFNKLMDEQNELAKEIESLTQQMKKLDVDTDELTQQVQAEFSNLQNQANRP